MPYAPFANQEFRNFFQTHLEIPTLLRALPIAPGARILEIGCGRGVALPRLSQLCRPSRLVGIDIAPDLIALARRRVRRWAVEAELYPYDVRDMPFGSGEFDVVIDFGTCYHIDEPEFAIREINRVLGAGGMFIHETLFAQLLAHPIRTSGKELPWRASLDLKPYRDVVLWAARKKMPKYAPTLATPELDYYDYQERKSITAEDAEVAEEAPS